MSDQVELVVATVLAELRRAESLFPWWPTDPVHAFAIVQEEAGEVQRAILHAVYEPGKGGPAEVVEEAVQLAALAIRFLVNERSLYYPG